MNTESSLNGPLPDVESSAGADASAPTFRRRLAFFATGTFLFLTPFPAFLFFLLQADFPRLSCFGGAGFFFGVAFSV